MSLRVDAKMADAYDAQSMTPIQERYGAKRIYEITPKNGHLELRLNDRIVELGKQEFDWYRKVADWLPSVRGVADLSRELSMDEAKVPKFIEALEKSGLLYKKEQVPTTMTGLEFHGRFNQVLSSWLSEAFAHPFWERMMSGKGSARLFSGWMIELYHYTKNANRHMPLSCAHGHDKAIKQLRAKHYAEEWNHYHYFMKSLKALGFAEADIAESVPLPMTLALSNFMRQAAHRDILAYSICSAVLEGTTTDRGQYNPYYEKSAQLYGIPQTAIAPIYAHLDLDVKYKHSDLFLDILQHVPQMSQERASLVLDYGHQLVEHIWLWTDNIEKFYQVESNPMPRRPFDALLD
jgi:pyrroloquinoline quinone (PQQ) biosynthesis protein C